MIKLAMSLVAFLSHSVPGLLLIWILTIISPVADALTIKVSSSKGELVLTDRVGVVTLTYYHLLVPYAKDGVPFKLSSLDLNDHRFMFSNSEEITYSIRSEELQWHVHGLGRRMANLLQTVGRQSHTMTVLQHSVLRESFTIWHQIMARGDCHSGC